MLKDLYAPARYLSDSHQGRHRREQFGAALRCCALFREELFFTDRTMLHSDAVFAAWMSDPEARALICSELVQVGSTEAWPEERKKLQLTGLEGTAQILNMRRLTADPVRYRKRLSDPAFCEYLSDFDKAKNMVESPIFLRDEIFGAAIEGEILSPEGGVIDSICAAAEIPASGVDKRFMVDEFRRVLELSKDVAGPQNIGGRRVLGFIHFYPADHPRAAQVGSFFHFLQRRHDLPHLREVFNRRAAIRRLMEWVDANVVAAEARTFGRGVVMSDEFRADERVIAGVSLAELEEMPGLTKTIPLGSWLFTPSNLCLLTAEDIFELRKSRPGRAYFAQFHATEDALRGTRIEDVVEDYLVAIVECLRSKGQDCRGVSRASLALTTVRDSNRFLIKVESLLGDKAVSAAASALFAIVGIPNALHLAVRGALKLVEKTTTRTSVRSELVVPRNPEYTRSMLRVHFSDGPKGGER
jgi:hypothetical protein